MDDDWDLQAVVRSCGAATTSSSTTPSPPLPSPITTLPTTSSNALNLQSFCSSNFQPQLVEENNLICFQDLFEPRQDKDIVIKELHDLCKPFFFQTSKLSQPISPQSAASPLSVLGCFQDLSSQQHQQTSSIFSTKKSDSSNTHNPRPKKGKNQMKKVCQIPVEGVSSDMWSWRKYGQKPIKGSPYPRGYYKCNTSKGCLARKQVERDRSDPKMLIVAYTGEHNHPMLTHRKSLAGTTHQNTAAITTDYGAAAEKLESSAEDKEATAEEEEDDFDISNMPLDDEFFAGLDNELVRPSSERLFSGNNSISLVVE